MIKQVKTVVITGASSGIGKSISDLFSRLDCFDVICIKSRLEKIDELQKEVLSILKIKDIDVLINNAGVGSFVPHEELSLDKIEQLLDVNLKAPIVLTNLFLRSLKKTKGHVINISSIESTRHSKFSALYTATKSGLRDFSLCLFEEVRKFGVRVTSINPDITKTNFFNDFNFKPSSDEQTYLNPEDIASSVLEIVNSNMVITDITIRPQRFLLTKKKSNKIK